MKRSERLTELRTRADFLRAQGVLLITREPPPAPAPAPGQPPIVAGNPAEGVEVLLSVWDDGTALGLHGHVDLGTGIRTALAQIVADELDLEMDQVDMVLGDTARAPNQGPTIASASIQIHALPLRKAAAQDNAVAQNRLAHIYAEGLGVEASPQEAREWRDRAHDAGLNDPSLDYLNNISVEKKPAPKATGAAVSAPSAAGKPAALDSSAFDKPMAAPQPLQAPAKK